MLDTITNFIIFCRGVEKAKNSNTKCTSAAPLRKPTIATQETTKKKSHKPASQFDAQIERISPEQIKTAEQIKTVEQLKSGTEQNSKTGT